MATQATSNEVRRGCSGGRNPEVILSRALGQRLPTLVLANGRTWTKIGTGARPANDVLPILDRLEVRRPEPTCEVVPSKMVERVQINPEEPLEVRRGGKGKRRCSPRRLRRP